MKKILLLTTALVSFVFMNAQDTCATAVAIGPGPQVVAAINGTPPTLFCAANGNFDPAANPDSPAGEWYLYTATVDGVATITTDLATNIAPLSTDTRFHVYTGTCGALVCAGGNDDVSGTNYLSESSFTISTGDTFYIAFDNRWSSLGFNFEVNETPISCVLPTQLTCEMTVDSATLKWTSNDNETLWNVEYGSAGFTQGSIMATMVTGNASTSLNISGLPAATAYDFYVQADCGAVDGLSTWSGPFTYKTLDTPVGCGIKTPSNNFQNGISCQAPVTQVNDITVPMGSDMMLNKVRVPILVNDADTVSSVNLYVYDDNAGIPGTAIFSQSGITPTTSTILGTAFTSFNVTELELDFTPVALAGGTTGDTKYWIGISVVTSDTANACYWETTTASITGSGIIGSADGVAFTTEGIDAFTEGVYSFEATCAPTASTNEEILASAVTIYPTATNELFTIDNQSNIALNNVTLFDVNGKVVLSQDLENLIGTKSINVSNLASGMYFVELNSADAKLTMKLIKK